MKLIGDEAMLVCPEAPQAVRAALEILDKARAVDIPPARAGISFGDQLLQGGDYFGSPVNLASRIVDHASSRTVIVDEQTAKSVQDEPDLALVALSDTALKGIGTIPRWQARARTH